MDDHHIRIDAADRKGFFMMPPVKPGTSHASSLQRPPGAERGWRGLMDRTRYPPTDPVRRLTARPSAGELREDSNPGKGVPREDISRDFSKEGY
jgi:hypothetical protein